MELGVYLETLWRRKWAVVSVAVTFALAAVWVTLAMPLSYAASTTLRVATTSGDSVDYGATVYAERLMRTYAIVATSAPVVETIRQQFGLDELPEIDVQIVAETELIDITVKHQDPVLAADMANYLATFLIEESKRVRDFRDHPAYIVGPATVPTHPSTPGLELTVPLSLVVGLGCGLGLALLLENLSTTLYTAKHIEDAAQAQVLAQIPKGNGDPPALILNPDTPRGDAFRRLQINLFGLNGTRTKRPPPNRTLVVTSVRPGEGKSTIVAHLAQTIAQTNRRVVVVDCDLRKPSLHKIFGLSNGVGLSSVLLKVTPLQDAIQSSDIPRVHVLTGGPLLNPTESLASSEMSRVLEELVCQYDHVLLDTPPLLPLVDAAAIAPGVDGTLLVVEYARVRRGELEDVLRQLALSHSKLVGVVMNRTSEHPRYYERYHSASRDR